VVGIDLSEKMLARARATTCDSLISFKRADLERVELPEARFDLAYSSLALHYIKDVARLFATIHRAPVGNGSFVFSTEHPIYMAPTTRAGASMALGAEHGPWTATSWKGPGPPIGWSRGS
jgi:ubiquinone/menaquinone biosynthesis C-methylase UbiE